MTAWIYVGLVALLLAAVPTTVWLKRAGDRAWAERQRRAREAELLRPIGEAFLRFQIEVARQMNEVGKVMARAFEQLDAATEQALHEQRKDDA